MVHVSFSYLTGDNRDERLSDILADSPFKTAIMAQNLGDGWDGRGDSCFPG